eukprot:364186-Chlamydomonas_euryale.AAC.4
MSACRQRLLHRGLWRRVAGTWVPNNRDCGDDWQELAYGMAGALAPNGRDFAAKQQGLWQRDFGAKEQGPTHGMACLMVTRGSASTIEVTQPFQLFANKRQCVDGLSAATPKLPHPGLLQFAQQLQTLKDPC